MYGRLLKQIKKYDTVIIHRHSYPDLDALGSQLGLRESLRLSFPNKNIYAVGEMLDQYAYIGEMDVVSDDVYEGSLVLILDTGALALVSDDRYTMGDYLIKIDHHMNREVYGDMNIVKEDYASTCEIVTEFIVKKDLGMNEDIARYLYSGIVADTGRFMYSNVSKKTFKLAGHLLAQGIDITSIYHKMYEQTPEVVRLKGYFLANYQTTDAGVAYMTNGSDVLERFNVDFFTCSRGMVNQMANIQGVPVWVNFTEHPETKKIIMELRGKTIEVVEIAMKYGGGGHKLACGATLDDWDTCFSVLRDLNELVLNN